MRRRMQYLLTASLIACPLLSGLDHCSDCWAPLRLAFCLQYLLTASLDGTIKIWSPGSSGAEVVNPQPEFRWPEEEAGSSGGRGYQRVRAL